MIFIEASLFTKRLHDYLNDDQYRELQDYLMERPEAGDLMQETGGLRKLRWSSAKKGQGKRSGLRIIYYWYVSEDQIYFFTLYAKNEASDLTDKEKKILRLMLKEWQ